MDTIYIYFSNLLLSWNQIWHFYLTYELLKTLFFQTSFSSRFIVIQTVWTNQDSNRQHSYFQRTDPLSRDKYDNCWFSRCEFHRGMWANCPLEVTCVMSWRSLFPMTDFIRHHCGYSFVFDSEKKCNNHIFHHMFMEACWFSSNVRLFCVYLCIN